jgi:hypothetical protein
MKIFTLGHLSDFEHKKFKIIKHTVQYIATDPYRFSIMAD